MLHIENTLYATLPEIGSEPFRYAISAVLYNEGGVSEDSRDPGGRTAYGISEKAHPEAWADGPPSLEEALKIYHDDYWLRIWGGELPLWCAVAVLDFAVNSGPGRAIRYLNAALLLPNFSVMTTPAVRAVCQSNPWRLVADYNHSRIQFLRSLQHWQDFGAGWSSRVSFINLVCSYVALYPKPWLLPQNQNGGQ